MEYTYWFWGKSVDLNWCVKITWFLKIDYIVLFYGLGRAYKNCFQKEKIRSKWWTSHILLLLDLLFTISNIEHIWFDKMTVSDTCSNLYICHLYAYINDFIDHIY